MKQLRCERCGERSRGDDACAKCGGARGSYPCAVHPSREAIGRCVICGRALCSKCRQGDSHALLCEDHANVTVLQGWVQLYSTTREFHAELLKENLAAEGIEARVFSQRDNMFSVDVGELSIVRLLVPVGEYARGMELIRSHMDEQGEVRFACPQCGEAYEPGAGECSECGNVLEGLEDPSPLDEETGDS